MSEREDKPRVWQRMLSGCELDLISPDPSQIQPEDIALGLSRQHRWNGQTQGLYGYSVAQHSIMVAELLHMDSITCLEDIPQDPTDPEKWRRAALLHDGAEYVCHDLISPLKNAVGDVFREVEATLMEAIHDRFNLPKTLPDCVKFAIKQADLQACVTEAVQLAKFSKTELSDVFGTSLQPLQSVISVWSEAQARVAFLEALERYSPLLRQETTADALSSESKAVDLKAIKI